MAEIVGLAASIVQLGGAGVELSIKLHNFVTSTARADKDILDLAEDLDSTGSALDHVGSTLRAKNIRTLASSQATNVALKIVKRCESIFAEVQYIIQKRWKVDKHGHETLTLAGKLSWPLKEQRVELIRKRLDSLKLSLSLLLDVLKLRQGEAQGKLKFDLEKKRQTIRELYKQRARAVQRELELEAKVKDLELQETVTHPAASRPEPGAHVPGMARISLHSASDHPQVIANHKAARLLSTPQAGAYDDETSTTDDEGGVLTLSELNRCATQVHDLLLRINDLQRGFKAGNIAKHHHKRRMYKSYQRFCRRFEVNLVDMSAPAGTRRKRKRRVQCERLAESGTSTKLGTQESSESEGHVQNIDNEQSEAARCPAIKSRREGDHSVALDPNKHKYETKRASTGEVLEEDWLDLFTSIPLDAGEESHKDVVDALLEQWTLPTTV
ncbi:hypothetical protein E8E11_000362 [Didymella keratinophila]|nr:hypothetical protein E8E11_000362 [Didymella keratinophila]